MPGEIPTLIVGINEFSVFPHSLSDVGEIQYKKSKHIDVENL